MILDESKYVGNRGRNSSIKRIEGKCLNRISMRRDVVWLGRELDSAW